MPLRPRWRHGLVGFLVGLVVTWLVTLALLNALPGGTGLSGGLHDVSAVRSPQFRKDLSSVLGAPLVAHNRVVDLEDGDQIFPTMLAAIRGAQHSVNFEDYIYSSGRVSKKFVDALTERARAGVAVRVLVDWVGASRMDGDVVTRLRSAGVKFEYFHPLRFQTLADLNNRTHRRLLIVDGRIAFTGGVGIADKWSGDARRGNHWRDMEFQVTGPLVARFQGAFEDHWISTTGKVLLGPTFYPPLESQGNVDAQVFVSSPGGGKDDMQLLFLMAIEGARRSIDVEAGYFIPDALAIDALKHAMARGVTVRLLVPGEHVESNFVQGAGRTTWATLLKSGAQLYRYQPARLHCKMMIVDGYLTIVGSTNFDDRSFKLNDEDALNVFDQAFASHMTDVFENDLTQSRQVTWSQWQQRPRLQRLHDWFAGLFASQF